MLDKPRRLRLATLEPVWLGGGSSVWPRIKLGLPKPHTNYTPKPACLVVKQGLGASDCVNACVSPSDTSTWLGGGKVNHIATSLLSTLVY